MQKGNLSATRGEPGFRISGIAEQLLRDRELLMGPIAYFDRVDRFLIAEEKLALELEPFLTPLTEAAARRILRSYAFADELFRIVLRSFHSSLSEDGRRPHSLLWAAAVLLDQLLDESKVGLAQLLPVREWVRRLADCAVPVEDGKPQADSNEVNTFVSMLECFFTDCRRRSRHASEYEGLHHDVMRVLDAELLSPGLSLQLSPDERVRKTVYDKSVLLCWVGFRSCVLGDSLGLTQMNEYSKLSKVIGEILWIMDDLVDVEEDLDRGVWNRTLWELHDVIGEERFRQMIHSKEKLANSLREEGVIEQGILEIVQRLKFVESHSSVNNSSGVASMITFWMVLWLGIYA